MGGEVLRGNTRSRVAKGALVLGITVGLVGCPENNGQEGEPAINAPVLDRDAEAKSGTYEMAAIPYHRRPDDTRVMSKELPIELICHEPSATLMVDSILAEVEIKGLGRPIVGFVASYEFPNIAEDIYKTECLEQDLARINVDEF